MVEGDGEDETGTIEYICSGRRGVKKKKVCGRRSKKSRMMTEERTRQTERERESQVVADGLLPEINSFWGRVTMATQVTAGGDWLC